MTKNIKKEETTIFQKMTELSIKNKAINLGQGFPDEDGPIDIINKASESLNTISNQYPPMKGLASLRKNIAKYLNAHYKLEFDWDNEILITNGATEALASSILGNIIPGDEAIIFEPAYDSYKPIVEKAGGKAICVPLESPEWEFSYNILNPYITKKSKLIILNNPMNPLGKMFSMDELKDLSKIVIENNMIIISDEVHEHIVFDNKKHIPIISLPGMEHRVIKIGSAGKTFSLTGWKIGFAVGCTELINKVASTHQFITFTAPPNLQEAIAYAYTKPNTYYENLRNTFQAKRDLIYTNLIKNNIIAYLPESTYFINMSYEEKFPEFQPEEFCFELIKNAKVTGIPISVFYNKNAEELKKSKLIRLCFAKSDDILIKASNQIGEYFNSY